MRLHTWIDRVSLWAHQQLTREFVMHTTVPVGVVDGWVQDRDVHCPLVVPILGEDGKRIGTARLDRFEHGWAIYRSSIRRRGRHLSGQYRHRGEGHALVSITLLAPDRLPGLLVRP